MNEQQSEHKTCLDRARNMSFGELRRRIDALKRSSNAGPDAEFPNSKQDFLDLWQILYEKVYPPRQEMPEAPPPPVYEGPPPISRWGFRPSDELASMRERHDRLVDLLDEALADSSPGQYIGFLEDQLRDLVREIDERESDEQREHARRVAEYEDAWAAHQQRVRAWRVQTGQERPRRTGTDLQAQIVQRIRRAIERKAWTDVPTEHVRWRLLPPDELSEDRVRGYYTTLQRKRPGTRYDPDRIVKALSLGPNQRYEEIGEVEGYTVFTFPYTLSVLLECPIVGNAIYVIHKDWERWSRMSKQELMADESGEVVRIVHRAGWFEKVRQALGTPMAYDSGLSGHTDDTNMSA